MNFSNFELSEPLQKSLLAMGFTEATEIQEKAMPLLLREEIDFVGLAQTGTGKTAAYLLPMLEKIDLEARTVKTLIITPTRELANQVHGELQKFAQFLNLRSLVVYGGSSYTQQIDGLKRQLPQVVVGTPGRLLDLIDRRVLKLSDCEQLIIDEADEMLNMGFLDDVQKIIGQLSNNKNLWMFSATMPPAIEQLIRKDFKEPQTIKINSQTLSNQNIHQTYLTLAKKDFAKAMRRILACEQDFLAMAFCETKVETVTLAERLIDLGLKVMALNGDLSQSQRDLAMKKFKAKQIDILVCTDVAARGIDVDNITHVFNFGLPRQEESYIHRTGRTGRAGNKGVAISLCTPAEMYRLKRIERLTRQKIVPFSMPSIDQVRNSKINNKLQQMDNLKQAIVEKGNDFKVDASFNLMEQYFKDMDREQILKVVFSYLFKDEIRNLEQELSLQPVSASRSERPRERSSKGRSYGRRDDRRDRPRTRRR